MALPPIYDIASTREPINTTETYKITTSLSLQDRIGIIIFGGDNGQRTFDAGVNAVTVARAGSDDIQGATTVSLATQYASRTLYADGSARWYVESSL